jgi:flagellar biosynthesis protein FlhB
MGNMFEAKMLNLKINAKKAFNLVKCYFSRLLKPSIKIDLQLFAGDDKTEKATPKKRQDARKKGQVFHSKEITSAVILLFLFVGLRIFGSNMYSELATYMKTVFTEYPQLDGFFTINTLTKTFLETVLVIIRSVAPLFAIAVISGLVAGYAQVGFIFTFDTLGMKFSRINPFSGLKRMFSLHSFVELIKSIIKITIACVIAYLYIKGEEKNVFTLIYMDPMNIAMYICNVSIDVAIRICVALALIGVLDFGYQWWEYEKNLRMSKQEIKDEYKQMEGNPEVKSKIKQKQRQISMRRMMNEVPKADVVITNPTHFAIAIKYDPVKSSAPIIIAKGQDFIALRIKEIAKENKIEIVENKPLARTLFETVEVGAAIPAELYQAVAEILAFVYSLKEKGRAG